MAIIPTNTAQQVQPIAKFDRVEAPAQADMMQQAPQPTAEKAPAGPKASEQMQQQYRDIVMRAMDVVYGQATPAIVNKIKVYKDKPPPAMIGQTAAEIVVAAAQSVQRQKGKVSAGVAFQAMNEVSGALIEVAQAAGVVPENDEAVGQQVFSAAAMAFGPLAVQAGLVSDEEGAEIAQFMSNPQFPAEMPNETRAFVRGAVGRLAQGGQPKAQPQAQQPSVQPVTPGQGGLLAPGVVR